MSQHVLEYRKPTRRYPPDPYILVSTIALLIVIIAINVALLALAANDRSWGAMGIMLFVGPAANATLALLSIPVALVLHSLTGSSAWRFVMVGILIPLAAIFIDGAIIASMGLHGC